MIEVQAAFLCYIYEELEGSINALSRTSDPRSELSKEVKGALAQSLALCLVQSHKNLLLDDDLFGKIQRFQTELLNNEPLTAESVIRELRGIRNQTNTALIKRKFLYIPPPDDQYYNIEKLFGDRVYVLFANARADIKDAGNSIAVGLDTACVFHLMRVSEQGLRALAKRLKVSLKDKGKPIPLEYGTWDKVISACASRIATARQKHVGPAKQARLNLYSEAADHCTFMKDIWRNNLSHTRNPYSHEEALATLGRVRDFMHFLAGVLE